MARLGDAFSVIRNGASIRQADGAGGLPITRIETISNREIDRSKFGYAGIEDADKYREYILQDGDILMSHINSEKHLGKVALYKKQGNEKIIHGMNLLMLRANKSIVYPPFATYFFATNIFLGQIQKITKKSVNQASFTVSALKEIEMDLPTLDEQRRIALVLDKVSDLIAKRRQQLGKLDEMVKARFVEMFGDPVENPMGWEKLALGKRCDIVTGNTPSRAEPENYGNFIEWIKSDNINTPAVLLTEAQEYLSETGFHKCRFVEAGSLLMTCIAGSINCIGNVAVADRRVAFNQQINAIVPKQDDVLYLYWLMLLSKPAIHSTINMALKGILSKGQLSEMAFPFPPLELQNQFSVFVKKTEKTKANINRSLEKLETLKKALMQEYFG